MSDSSIYELEDIVWELGDSDDHIVPHLEVKKGIFSIESDNSKRPRLEPRCTEKERMLDKTPWAHSPSQGVSPSLDEGSSKKNPRSTSGEERIFNQCIRNSNIDPLNNRLCVNDPILCDRKTCVDNSLYQYHLNNANSTGSELGFFGNNLDDKEENDLLYYRWSDIENFEDVDQIFRNCDSTFGLDIEHNDELGWFSSHGIEGSNDVAKPSVNVESEIKEQEVNNEFNAKRSSSKSTSNGSSTIMNGSRVVSDIDAKSQVHAYVSEPQLQKSSNKITNEHPSENGASFIQFDNPEHINDPKHPLNFQSSFPPENHQHHESSQSNPNHHSSNQVLPRITSSITKNEDSGIPSLSQRESSFGSNTKPPLSRNKKKDRRHKHGFPACSEKRKLMVQRRDFEPISSRNNSEFDNEVEGQSEVDGDVCIVTELECSNVQESSCISSVLDEVSIDTSSFHQLQDVMEKLDIRTKLCIRDSLYRLARSAEKRHKCLNPTISDNDDKDTSGTLLSDGANNGVNRCTGFMDMETDTNPIDRSIAHLLFHRPSDPSTTRPFDTLPLRSHLTDQAHNEGPLATEKPLHQEETTSVNGQVAEH